MTSDSSGKTALIFGASRGIGAATATRFLEAGYRVAGTHRGTGVPDGVDPIMADMRDPASLHAAIKTCLEMHGGLDTVVVNAGITRQDLLIRMQREAIDEVFEVNTFGPMEVVKATLRAMVPARAGSIILVSSESSRTGIPGSSHYTASKAALEGFARSIMWEYGGKGVRINVIAPGATRTDMFAQVTEEEAQSLIRRIPLRRIAEPSEIADAILWVSECTYMTGATIPVTGGEGLGY
jgi:beta-ketoacyl ACP reductase